MRGIKMERGNGKGWRDWVRAYESVGQKFGIKVGAKEWEGGNGAREELRGRQKDWEREGKRSQKNEGQKNRETKEGAGLERLGPGLMIGWPKFGIKNGRRRSGPI